MAWLISNQTGIKASFDKDIIVFRKRGDDRVFNQWAEATLKLPSLTIGEGFIISYDIKWNEIANTSEVKMHSPFNLANGTSILLRFHDGTVSWVAYEKDGSFYRRGASKVKADGVWHTVLYHYRSDSFTIFEDGDVALKMDVGPEHFESFSIPMQTLEDGSVFYGEIRNVVTMPTAFHTDLPSLRTTEEEEVMEVVFSTVAMNQSKSRWVASMNSREPIAVEYTSGSLRFSARDPTIRYEFPSFF